MFEKCSYCNTTIVANSVRGHDGRYYCSKEHQTRVEGDRESQKRDAERAKGLAQLAQAQIAYQHRLAKLRESPADPAIRAEALDAGRVLAAWTRHAAGQGSGITLLDETSIANEVAAAAAGATLTVSRSPEQRLERLEGLKAKGLISEQEYQEKRAAILADL